MAIIRESVNLTAGLGQTIYTVPTGKQSSLSVSVANAADTYVAVQATDLANSPVPISAGTFSDSYFNVFTSSVGYRTTGSIYDIYRLQASDNWIQSISYPMNNGHPYQIPLTTAYNYNQAVANFTSNDIDWRPNGAFSTVNATRTGNNILSLYGSGGAHISTSGASFQANQASYSIYNNLSTTATLTTVTSGHWADLHSSGWRANNMCGSNLYNGNSTQYIYMNMRISTDAPLVVMWDSGDLNASNTNTASRAVRFTGIDAGAYIKWIQESGGYTMIATNSDSGSSGPKLWIVQNSAWLRGATNSLADLTTNAVEITDAAWSSLNTATNYKPFVDGASGKFYFRNASTPYPFFYDAVTNTWDTTGYPTALTYPAELAGLEATLGDAYSFYKYSSTLNDYYIVSGNQKYTLNPNYESLDANSSLLSGLQNDSEKGGLTLKAGDKVIAYDTLSGGTVVQVYGYEEDA